VEGVTPPADGAAAPADGGAQTPPANGTAPATQGSAPAPPAANAAATPATPATPANEAGATPAAGTPPTPPEQAATTAATTDGGTPAIDPATGQPVAGAAGPDLTKGGWVIQLVGHHFHNSNAEANVQLDDEATGFVIHTFCKALESGTVMLPDGENGALVPVKIADLGIKFPTVVSRERLELVDYRAESEEEFAQRQQAATNARPGQPAAVAAANQVIEPKKTRLRQYNFYLQFIWQPQTRTARLEKEKQKQLAEQPGGAEGTASVAEDPAKTGT
jgi:hypothetical protein